MNHEMEIPDVHSFRDVFNRAATKATQGRKKAALVWPDDIETIMAAMEAREKNLIDLIIIGDERIVRTILRENSFNASEVMILNMQDSRQAIDAAVRKAQGKEVDLIIQGQIPMAEVLAALTSPQSGFCLPGKTAAHVAVMKPEKYPKLLMLTDSAVVPVPDLSQKINLISNLVFVFRALGLDNPRIAIVSAVEAIYPQMPVTLDAAVLAKMAERGQIKWARVDGPLSFDVAIDMTAAQAKGIRNSPVAGQADAMVASTIEVANGVYLAMSLYGRCDIGGVLVGGRVPVATNFPSDSPSSRFNSILLALLLS